MHTCWNPMKVWMGRGRKTLLPFMEGAWQSHLPSPSLRPALIGFLL